MAVSKAELVRRALAAHPDLGPSDIAQMVMKDNPKLVVRSQEVSSIKTEMKSKGLFPPSPAATEDSVPATSLSPSVQNGDDLPTRLARLKEAAQALGGAEEAKRILDLLR